MGWQPLDNLDNYDLVDEDDDLHILQYRLKEKSKDKGGFAYIQRIRIVDTLHEDKFNARQEEIRKQSNQNIEEAIVPVIKQFQNKTMTSEEMQRMKQLMADVISQNPIIGISVRVGELFIKYIGQNTYELILPSYNIGPISFSL